MRNGSRSGLTLIEVIVAMLLFSSGALALAATSAFVARQMRLNNLRSHAAITARNTAEQAIALGCNGIHSSQSVVCE